MHVAILKGRGDFAEWRDPARAYLMAGVEPERIDWRTAGGEAGLFSDAPTDLPAPSPDIPAPNVPAEFLTLSQAVICHGDPARFALLYRLLFRLARDRNVLDMRADADVAQARRWAQSVRRDCHKMTAFVRFKEMPLPPGVVGRRRFIAWFEPDHFIVARIAPFFQRRFADMDWLIATPKGSIIWDGAELLTSDQPAEKPDLTDQTDDLWRTYYASIFNPARLKVKMMMTEMPKKYWKNLPEAALIPELIASAEARVIDMAARAPTIPPSFHHKLRVPLPVQEDPAAEPESLEALRAAARVCDRCPIHCNATQTVFGEGPAQADVMIVGEQPGDEEDLAGRPFVGPAGRLLNGVLAEAGIDRGKIYMTNAVKHFKYEPRGKRRIHQRPDKGEVDICRWWLTREIELVKPKLIVATGATAVYSLTGQTSPLSQMRGESAMGNGITLFVTVHPSYLLRLPDEHKRAEELARFQQDFQRIAAISRGLPG
ncbi:UdgX family uracil-DNA binding protein [Rhizobium sp. RU36D]|uniref:UdgX family uracil-DNA binding protein n=1 Tax=Rhizobium sp. RU36D TaxID=1907415 RepID=UPI0009D7DE2A|nr:UdgX family uracil-DNA binding protein [Rhizobium sp. RU36D]SMC60816.1 DNA polymerase [Rhizobium sp. RU36D]